MSFHEGSKFQEDMENARKEKERRPHTPPQPTSRPSRDKVEFYLSRHVRNAEDAASVDHERMARAGASYAERRAAEEKTEQAKHEADALRAALDCVREFYKP